MGEVPDGSTWVCHIAVQYREYPCRQEFPHFYCKVMNNNLLAYRMELDEEEGRIVRHRKPNGLWNLLKRGWL